MQWFKKRTANFMNFTTHPLTRIRVTPDCVITILYIRSQYDQDLK